MVCNNLPDARVLEKEWPCDMTEKWMKRWIHIVLAEKTRPRDDQQSAVTIRNRNVECLQSRRLRLLYEWLRLKEKGEDLEKHIEALREKYSETLARKLDQQPEKKEPE